MRPPRISFAINEINVSVWNCTLLIVPGWKSASTAQLIIRRISNLEGSVRQLITPTSSLASKVRGVPHSTLS
jgi:hypothetical protein